MAGGEECRRAIGGKGIGYLTETKYSGNHESARRGKVWSARARFGFKILHRSSLRSMVTGVGGGEWTVRKREGGLLELRGPKNWEMGEWSASSAYMEMKAAGGPVEFRAERITVPCSSNVIFFGFIKVPNK